MRQEVNCYDRATVAAGQEQGLVKSDNTHAQTVVLRTDEGENEDWRLEGEHNSGDKSRRGKVIPVTGRGDPYGSETSRLPHYLDNQLIDGGRLSALRAGRPLPPGRFLVLVSVGGWVDSRAIVRLEGLGQLKSPIISSGIEPATFRLVAQCLNQLRYHVLHELWRLNLLRTNY
jgi:hypothetical protein